MKIPIQENAARNFAVAFILGALFISGFSSLAYEIVWQRLLIRLVGASLPSAMVIFCIFMAGLGAGALLSALLLKKAKNALPLYALLEIAIGLIGLIMPFVFEQSLIDLFLLKATRMITLSWLAITGFAANHHGGHFVRLMASLPFEFTDLSFGLLVLLLLAAMFTATLLMGATFNCMTKVVADNYWLHGRWFGPKGSLLDSDRIFSRKLMCCYFVNLCGAAFGSVETAFAYIPSMGLMATSTLMASLNVIVAISMFRLARVIEPGFAGAEAQSRQMPELPGGESLESSSAPESLSLYTALPLAFCFSFVSMALEVVWTRLLCLVLGSSTYAVGGVLSVNLIGLAMGALVAAGLAGRSVKPLRIIASAALLAAIYLAASLFLIPRSVWLFLCLQQFFVAAHSGLLLTFIVSRLLVSIMIILPPALCLGLVFPCLIGSGVSRNKAVWTMGKLLAGSTIGSICGALAAGALIPNSTWVSGMEFCLIALTCVLLGLALVADALRPREDLARRVSPSRILFVGCCAIPILVLTIRPQWDTTLMSTGASFLEVPAAKLSSFDEFNSAIKASSRPPLFYDEGINSTVTVETNARHNVIFLKNNGKVEAALPIDWRKPAPTSDARTQVLLGALPVLNCSANGMEALVIGLGSGITAGTMLKSDRIAHLRICELEPAVLTASHLFDAVNLQPLRKNWIENKRVDLLCVDGRVLLTRSPQWYDIIVSQPSEPWISGSSDLFTREFWQLAKGRLNPYGVFCQWLQLYCIDRETLSQLIATFSSVFPTTYIFQPAGSGEILLVGYPVLAPFDLFGNETVLAERMRQSNLQEVLADVGIPEASALQSDLLLTPAQVHGLVGSVDKRQFNTDSNLKTEYRLPPELLFNQNNLLDNLIYLKGARAANK
jgi:spermidine synthase